MMVDADEVSWADRGGRRDAAADRPGRRGPVAWATAEGIAVRLIGGVAIDLRSSCRTRSMLGRSYGDFDLVAKRRESRQLHCLLEAHDYIPETVFNATHGEGRCSTATRVARTTSTVPICRISVPLFSGIVKGAEKELEPAGYSILLMNYLGDPNRDAKHIALLGPARSMASSWLFRWRLTKARWRRFEASTPQSCHYLFGIWRRHGKDRSGRGVSVVLSGAS